MEAKGARRFLQPALYIAVAALAHGLLFLIPFGFGGKAESGRTRGVRVRVQGEARGVAASPKPTRTLSPISASSVPGVPAAREMPIGAPGGGGGGSPGPASGGGAETSVGPVAGDTPPTSEYGSYLARLKSEGIQGWARESAGKQRQGWKGSGKSGTGWGGGAGTGAGTGMGSGTGPGAGGGTGGPGGGGGYLDPRVRMVVTHYPLDAHGNAIVGRASNLENSFRQIPYPDMKFRKAEYTSGWWNVYIRLKTDKSGKVVESIVLKPSTDGPLEKEFIRQVKHEIARWSFDRMEAEITVDVRFHVE